MPIYAYRCDTCGHAKDVLQKLSDPVLSVCPVCGASTFRKQLTAAGFQLKGSGWYATDFKGGPKATKPEEGGDNAPKSGAEDKPAEAKPADAKPAEAKPSEVKSDAARPAAPPPAAGPAPTPPAASGT